RLFGLLQFIRRPTADRHPHHHGHFGIRADAFPIPDRDAGCSGGFVRVVDSATRAAGTIRPSDPAGADARPGGPEVRNLADGADPSHLAWRRIAPRELA